MKIWIVNHYAVPPSIGSGMVRHYYFAKYLMEKGHSVKIITSGKIHNSNINYIKEGELYVEKIVDKVPFVFVKSKEYNGNGIERIINLMEFPFEVNKVMNKLYGEEKPDIIYTSSPDIFVPFFALKFGRKHKIPVVTEIRDLWPESIIAYSNMTEKNLIIRILYYLEKWIYLKSDKIVFTMEGGKDYIKEKKWSKKIDLNKVYHINNGIDLDEYRYDLEKFSLEDNELNDEEKFKIIYMGSIRKVNHLETLLDAAAILKEKGYNDIYVLIYGEGTEKKKLEQMSRSKNLNVFFKGNIKRKYVPYVLSKSNLNLINVMYSSLTKYGSSWNKLFEYMASGRPVLSNLPVNYDLIKRYDMGISEKFSSAHEYAEGILRIVNLKKERYEELCINAKNASEMFDYRKHADNLEKILKEVIRH